MSSARLIVPVFFSNTEQQSKEVLVDLVIICIDIRYKNTRKPRTPNKDNWTKTK